MALLSDYPIGPLFQYFTDPANGFVAIDQNTGAKTTDALKIKAFVEAQIQGNSQALYRLLPDGTVAGGPPEVKLFYEGKTAGAYNSKRRVGANPPL